MLQALHHTWLGGFLAYIILAGAWTVAPAFIGLVAAGMADRTYGTSFLCFGVVLLEPLQSRQILVALSLMADAYLGPRVPQESGFWRYWVCFVLLFLMTFYQYFSMNLSFKLKRSMGFHKLIQDLDFTKYHINGVELRGALSDIQKNSGSLFGFHPHGILSAGFGWNGVWSKQFMELSGAETQFMIDKGLREDNFFFKVIGDLHGGLTSLNKKNLFKALGEKRNVAFIPGGFEDATLAEFGVHRTAISKRTGFVKYALQNGCRVHCVYTFGECDTHYTFKGLLNFRLWLNKFGIPAVVIFGFPLFPLFPRPQARLVTYIGKAIEFPLIAEPTKEQVKEWHKVYVDALVQVFEQNKREAGLPESAKLEIW